jgi:DUF4097 and DUF4098 domain-containing protein YvlB
MQKYDTSTPITAVLDIPAGRVQLIAADRTDTTVEVLPADPARSRDVRTAEATTVTCADGVLRIHTPEHATKLVGRSGSLEITVQLPAGSHVEATTAASELRGVGRLGDIVFEGAHRHIKIDEAASVRLTAVDGDVEIGRLHGTAEITTARGHLSVAEAAGGTLALHTQSGDITIGAAAGVSAALVARTEHGRIDNTLKNDGTTTLDIHATTARGDISARSL